MKLIEIFTESDKSICTKLYNQDSFDILTKFIRYYDNDIKTLALSVLVNILFRCENQSLKYENHQYIPIIWGLSILTNLIYQVKNLKSKIKILKILSKDKFKYLKISK